jgi:glycosidase
MVFTPKQLASSWLAEARYPRASNIACSPSESKASPEAPASGREQWAHIRHIKIQVGGEFAHNFLGIVVVTAGLALGRDPERSPMSWDDSPQGGFTKARPWLPLGKDHDKINVLYLSRQPDSIPNLYRRLIRLRRENEALISGRVENLTAEGPLLRYHRTDGTKRFVILVNLGHEPQETGLGEGQIVISTFLDREKELINGNVSLRPAEGLVITEICT